MTNVTQIHGAYVSNDNLIRTMEDLNIIVDIDDCFFFEVEIATNSNKFEGTSYIMKNYIELPSGKIYAYVILKERRVNAKNHDDIDHVSADDLEKFKGWLHDKLSYLEYSLSYVEN